MSSLTCLFATVSLSLAAAGSPPAAAAPAPVPVANNVLPEKFYGTFKLDHSENMDEYWNAKGYHWFTKKVLQHMPRKKAFAKTSDTTKFDISDLTSWRDIHFRNVVLEKSFEEVWDGSKDKITFTLKDGHLFEHHKPLEREDAKEETYEYFFEGDFFLVRVTYEGVEGRLFYKRIAA